MSFFLSFSLSLFSFLLQTLGAMSLFLFFFFENHSLQQVTSQDAINGGETCGQVIWFVRPICYLQLSINVALNGRLVSTLPASRQLLFRPPPAGTGDRTARSLRDGIYPDHLPPPTFIPPWAGEEEWRTTAKNQHENWKWTQEEEEEENKGGLESLSQYLGCRWNVADCGICRKAYFRFLRFVGVFLVHCPCPIKNCHVSPFWEKLVP